MQRLIVGGGALVDVDDHRRFAFAAEHRLEEFGELALSERDVAALHADQDKRAGRGLLTMQKHTHARFDPTHVRPTVPVRLIVAEGSDAFPQNEQRVVDVPGLLQPLSERLGFVAALRTGQVTQRKPENTIHILYSHIKKQNKTTIIS